MHLWELVAACPHFYANLKPIDGAVDFFNKLVEKYCKDKSCILIDDLPKTCEKWEAAGGIAILCKQNYNEMLDII